MFDVTNFSLQDHPESCTYVENISDIENVLNKNNSLKIFHNNIRSLRKNFYELQTLIQQSNIFFNVIILTEIWIKQEESCIYSFPGYNAFYDCRENDRSGGIVMYIDPNEGFHRMDYNMISAELICVTDIKRSLCIIGMYRSHNYTIDFFSQEFGKLLMLLKYKNIYIIGDLNININSTETNILDYNCLLANYGFKHGIYLPTRITQISSSCIDHVTFRNKNSSIQNDFYVLKTFISDHYSTINDIYFIDNNLQNNNNNNARKNVNEINKKKIINWNLFNLQNFFSGFDTLKNNSNPQIIYTDFNKKINDNFQKSFTMDNSNQDILINNQKKIKLPWINNDILNLINLKEKLYKYYKKYPYLKHAFLDFKKISNKVAYTIKNAKMTYLNNKFTECGNNAKMQWDLINNIISQNLMKKKNNLTLPDSSSKKNLANNFNNYFLSIFNTDHTDIINTDTFSSIIPIVNSLYLPEISFNDLILTLNCLKKSKPGYDNISFEMLQNFVRDFPDLFLNIINNSFKHGIYYNELKISIIRPLYKAGDKEKLENYRPIANISIISKILEKIIKDKLVEFLEKNNFFSHRQYGFRKGKSTTHALMNYSKFILENINLSKKVASFFIDIKKAFDTLNQDILIKKLYLAGVRGALLDWCSSFIKHRTQLVNIGNKNSNIGLINTGVPQGAILSPILFLIYINDLCLLNIPGELFIFADDTAAVFIGDNESSLLNNINNGLCTITNWFKNNKLDINIPKCKYIYFNIYGNSTFDHPIILHDKNCLNISCNCTTIERVKTYKYLGIKIDDNLKWKTQITHIYNRLKLISFKIFYLKQIVDKIFLKKLYYAWIYPIINYSILIIGGNYPTNISSLNKINFRIYQTCFVNNVTTTNINSYNSSNYLTINQQFYYFLMIFIQKNKSFYELTSKNKNLRTMDIYKVQTPFKQIFANSHVYQGPKEYNNLPLNISSENSLFKFKKLLREHIINL